MRSFLLRRTLVYAERVCVLVLFVGRMLLLRDKLPLTKIYSRKRGVAVNFSVHLRQVKSVGQGKGLPVNVGAANDERIVIGKMDRGWNVLCDERAFCVICVLPCNHNRRATGEQAADRIERFENRSNGARMGGLEPATLIF